MLTVKKYFENVGGSVEPSRFHGQMVRRQIAIHIKENLWYNEHDLKNHRDLSGTELNCLC